MGLVQVNVIKLKKFIGDDLDKEITIPAFFVSLVNRALPTSAIVYFKSHDLDLDRIMKSVKDKEYYKIDFFVDEKSINKRIELSVNKK